MKLLRLLPLLLITFFSHAQSIHLTGTVIDAQSHKPIPYATISIPTAKVYVRANSKGKFEITVDKITSVDRLFSLA